MAVETTGSLVVGCVHGFAHHICISGTKADPLPTLTYVVGNPDGKLTSVTGSDLAYDIGAGALYIGDITNGPGGSAWTAR